MSDLQLVGSYPADEIGMLLDMGLVGATSNPVHPPVDIGVKIVIRPFL